uniref:Uncharacterized protein n=1 Tax=Oryza glumipatula TaxID=40148 RepID=A0A0E0BTB9_9ORYZ
MGTTYTSTSKDGIHRPRPREWLWHAAGGQQAGPPPPPSKAMAVVAGWRLLLHHHPPRFYPRPCPALPLPTTRWPEAAGLGGQWLAGEVAGLVTAGFAAAGPTTAESMPLPSSGCG